MCPDDPNIVTDNEKLENVTQYIYVDPKIIRNKQKKMKCKEE